MQTHRSCKHCLGNERAALHRVQVGPCGLTGGFWVAGGYEFTVAGTDEFDDRIWVSFYRDF